MASYILIYSSQGVSGCIDSQHRERGSALITAVLVLLGLALLGLSISAQQVLAHYQQITLDERRLSRQLATEELFDDIAQTLEMNGRLLADNKHGRGAHPFAEGSAGQRVLYSQTDSAECPHDFPTLSLCWRIQVRQAGTGFIRERLLVLPESGCAPPYWFPPQGRVVEAPPLPPADAPPESGDPQPVKPKPGSKSTP